MLRDSSNEMNSEGTFFHTNDDSELQTQAQEILDTIASMPFEQCQSLNREFDSILARPSIYGIRHRVDGLVYMGKTKSIRRHSRGGRKAFLWAWLDKYDDDDVQIAVQSISYWENPALLLEIEAIILRATAPPIQRPNFNRKVKRCKPNFKSNFPPLILNIQLKRCLRWRSPLFSTQKR